MCYAFQRMGAYCFVNVCLFVFVEQKVSAHYMDSSLSQNVILYMLICLGEDMSRIHFVLTWSEGQGYSGHF